MHLFNMYGKPIQSDYKKIERRRWNVSKGTRMVAEKSVLYVENV